MLERYKWSLQTIPVSVSWWVSTEPLTTWPAHRRAWDNGAHTGSSWENNCSMRASLPGSGAASSWGSFYCMEPQWWCFMCRAPAEFPGSGTLLVPASVWVVERTWARSRHCKGEVREPGQQQLLTSHSFLPVPPCHPVSGEQHSVKWATEVASGQRTEGCVSLLGPSSSVSSTKTTLIRPLSRKWRVGNEILGLKKHIWINIGKEITRSRGGWQSWAQRQVWRWLRFLGVLTLSGLSRACWWLPLSPQTGPGEIPTGHYKKALDSVQKPAAPANSTRWSQASPS